MTNSTSTSTPLSPFFSRDICFEQQKEHHGQGIVRREHKGAAQSEREFIKARSSWFFRRFVSSLFKHSAPAQPPPSHLTLPFLETPTRPSLLALAVHRTTGDSLALPLHRAQPGRNDVVVLRVELSVVDRLRREDLEIGVGNGRKTDLRLFRSERVRRAKEGSVARVMVSWVGRGGGGRRVREGEGGLTSSAGGGLGGRRRRSRNVLWDERL